MKKKREKVANTITSIIIFIARICVLILFSIGAADIITALSGGNTATIFVLATLTVLLLFYANQSLDKEK